MTAFFIDFDDDVKIPGLPLPALLAAARRATIEFCKDTLLWRADLPDVTLADSVPTYTLVPPHEGLVVDLRKVKVEGNPLGLRSREYLDTNHPDWESTVPQRSPTTAILVSPRQMQLWPTPNTDSVTDSLVAKVVAALRPSDDAETLDDNLWSDWRSIIAHGAKAYLYAQRGENWFDANEAHVQGRFFKQGIARGRFRRMTGVSNVAVARTGGLGINYAG